MVTQWNWNGRNIRYILTAHINRHLEAHNDMVWASQYVAYALPNKGTQVTCLLSSLHTTEPYIFSSKTTIQSDVTKREDFEEGAEFLLLMHPKTKPSNSLHNISDSYHGKGRGGCGRGRGRGSWYNHGSCGSRGGRGGRGSDHNTKKGTIGVSFQYYT